MTIGINKSRVSSLVCNAILLLSLAAQCVFAAENLVPAASSSDNAEELGKYQAQLEELESEYGPYHEGLLEPLGSIVSLLIEQGDYESALAVQSRQLQVTRTTVGFQHPDIIPVLRSIMANQLLLGNWQDISDLLEHIRYLQGTISDLGVEASLQAIDEQAAWYLSRVYLDETSRPARNFFAARSLVREAEKLAVDSFEEDSSELIPWLYKSALNRYHLVELLNAERSLGSDSIDQLIREDGVGRLQRYGSNVIDVDRFFGIGSRIPVVDADTPIGEAYLREGLGFVKKIAEVVELQQDMEAIAMAKIYHGDFQLLMDRGLGLRDYRKAREMLLEAGLEEERIELFFNRPTLIPVEQFFTRLEDAIDYQQQNLSQLGTVPEAVNHLGVFTAWSEALPSTAMPVTLDPFGQLDLTYNQIDMEFTISSRGGASSIDVITAQPDERKTRREGWQALRDIKFRPAVIEGRARRTRDVQIRYRFIAP